jgi:hypothetical protein
LADEGCKSRCSSTSKLQTQLLRNGPRTKLKPFINLLLLLLLLLLVQSVVQSADADAVRE